MTAWARAKDFVFPSRGLSDAEAGTVEDERHAFNRRRAMWVGPMMMAIHLVSAIAFAWLARAETPARMAYRRLEGIHAAMLFVVGAITWASAPIRARRSGEAIVVVYLLYGAALSVNAQQTSRTIDVFLVVVVILAFLFRTHAGTWTIASLASFVLLAVGVELIQPDEATRLSAFANGLPVLVVAWFISRTQLGGFVHEVLQRHTIERQRDALATLNERLDRQLREKVVDRARELSATLSAVGARRFDELRPGEVLRDRFVVERSIGRGGMGVVYRARDRLLDRPVAVKVLSRAGDAASLQRFLREVEATADIVHPAVARSFHVDVSAAGQLFHVQELVRGEALDDVQKRLGALPAAHVARIGGVLADALRAAHTHGIVHRDVKPANVILIAGQPGLKLVDFGISKLRAGAASGVETGAGVVVGTPAFMAPEQRRAQGETAEPADVYAVGATLFLLLRGDLPGAGAPRLAERRRSQRTDALPEVIAACLEEEAACRPTAAEVHRRLACIGDELGAPPLAAQNRALFAAAGASAVTTEA